MNLEQFGIVIRQIERPCTIATVAAAASMVVAELKPAGVSIVEAKSAVAKYWLIERRPRAVLRRLAWALGMAWRLTRAPKFPNGDA